MKNLFAFILPLCFCISLSAQIPRLISYQGLLTDGSGQAVVDGNYAIEVKIFDAASAGTELWSESHAVNTSNGIFNIVLGSNTNLDLSFDAPYFVSTSVDGEELLPRIALTASPYALNTVKKTRSVTVTPGMISDANIFGNVSRGTIGGFRYPSIDFPDEGFQDLTFQFPFPADYDGQGFTVRILYTSTTNTGDIDFGLGTIGSAIGGDLGRAPGGVVTLPPPVAAGTLAEVTKTISGDPNNILDPDSKIISVLLRRSGDSAVDTSTGVLRIVGLVFEYAEK